MDKIVSFGKSRGSNGQHVQLMTKELEAIPQESAEELGFAEQRAVFAKAANNEISCYKPFKGYLDTDEVETADAGRDDEFYFYQAITRAYADFCSDAEKRELAKKLLFLFNEAGQVAKMDYAAETATLTQLVAKMRQEPYLSALSAIGIETAPDKIEAANQRFDAIYSQRATEEYSRTTTRDMKELRPVTDEAFDQLVEAINALYMVATITKDETKREALQKIIDDANVHLYRYKKTMDGSAAGTGEETPDTETPTDPSTGDDTQEPENPDGGDGGDEENPSGPGIPNP